MHIDPRVTQLARGPGFSVRGVSGFVSCGSDRAVGFGRVRVGIINPLGFWWVGVAWIGSLVGRGGLDW